MHRLARLREVQHKGAPAQAERAQELIAVLGIDGEDETALSDADALIEAYLHDPYLEKDVPGNGMGE